MRPNGLGGMFGSADGAEVFLITGFIELKSLHLPLVDAKLHRPLVPLLFLFGTLLCGK